MKRFLSLLLSVLIIISSTVYIFAVETYGNVSDKTSENDKIHNDTYISKQLELIADTYADRYIIKNSDDISEEDVSLAYSEAENESERAINSIKETNEDSFNKMVSSLNSPSEDAEYAVISEDAQQVLQTFEIGSDSTEINVSELNSGIKIIELPEKVNPDVFMQSLSSDLQGDIEYVQPDYELELSDFDDTDALDDPQENKEEIEDATDSEPVEEEESNSPDTNESNANESGTIDFDVVEVPDNSVGADAPSSDLIEEAAQTEAPIEEEISVPTPFESQLPEVNDHLNFDTVYNLQDDIQSAWQITRGSGVRIAVIDSKVDITHPDLVEHVSNSYDIVNGSELTYDENMSDQYYHGTHVTGIIASTVPEAEIIPIAAFQDGQAYTSDIIKAINYAEEQGAAIVNCSWGNTDNNQALKEAMQESGMVFVCAAGNNRMNVDETPIYPACYDIDNVISVTSLNQDLGFSYYSNYGEQIDIAMYGRDVYNTLPGGVYGEQSGTSMAAAYVTAGAAMAESINADGNIKDIVLNSAVSLSNLQNKVNGGRKLSYSNLVRGIVDSGIIEVTPEDDFDVNGCQRTPEENWELFNSLETVHIEAGGNNTAFIKSDGSLWMAGDNTYGQLGNGTYESASVPVQVIGLKNVKQVSVGETHCVALTDENRAYAWGDNRYREVTDYDHLSEPIPAILRDGVKFVEAGSHTTFTILSDNVIYARGKNDYGQLGGGTRNMIQTYAKVKLDNIESISSYGNHTFFMGMDDMLYACGSNNHNVLGINAGTTLEPQLVMQKVWKVETGYNHAICLTIDNAMFAWGTNTWGQCAQNDSVDKVVCPTMLTSGIDDIKNELTSGKEHSVLLLENGKIMTWGYNNYGQIGNGTKLKQYVPYLVEGVSDIVEIAAGEHHTVALDKNGKVWCWGNNKQGQYGNGTRTTSFTPIVSGITYSEAKTTAQRFMITSGDEYILVLTASNIPMIKDSQIIVTYNTDDLEIIDAVEYTYGNDVLPGFAIGSDININKIEDGQLVITKDYPYQNFTGFVNSIKFKAKKTIKTSVVYSIK